MNTNEQQQQKQQFNLLQNVMDTTINEQNSMNVSLNHFDGLTATLNLSNAISLNNMNQQQHQQQQQQQQQQVMKQLIDQNGQYNQNNGGIFIGI